MIFEFVSLDTVKEIAHQYGYWAVFLGITLENTGVPLPGETITLVGGYLAGSGELGYWPVLGSAIVGAILGDNFGYWIGRWGGWPLLLRLGKVFRFSEEQLIEIRTQFSQNAAKAVFFGRFIALLRIFAGPMAGIARMRYWQFLLCNAAGAATWASAMVSLSYFVGHTVSLEQLIAWVSQFALLALVVMVAWLAIPPWLESRKAKDLS